MEQSIENFEGTKIVNIEQGESMGDVQAGIEFIYHMREHILDVGDSTLHWIIVLVNNITSRYDWPLDQVALSEFVADKYSNVNGTHHHEINATSGDTTKKLIVSSDTTGATAVTNFEHEQTVNDDKRKIRLYVGQFVSEFEKLIQR